MIGPSFGSGLFFCLRRRVGAGKCDAKIYEAAQI